MDFVRHEIDQRFQEGSGGHSIGLLFEPGKGEFGGTVDSDVQVQLAFLCADFGEIDMKVADRIRLEALLGRLVAVPVRQPADPLTLKAAVQA